MQKLDKTIFYIDDCKAGQRFYFNHNKKEYLLLTNNVLVSVDDGKIAQNINMMYNNISKAYDSNGEQIAIRLDNKIFKYNPLIHDKELITLKTLNKLKTFEQIELELLKEKLIFPFTLANYRKVTPTKLMVNGLLQNFTTFIKEVNTQQRYYKKNTNQTYYNSVSIMLYKIEIDKKRELYLYKYQLMPCVFDPKNLNLITEKIKADKQTIT